ncbi:MAG: glutamate formiminotransferase / 5-formyltetrahydrofolate cyclo-ligase [Actinomycetota bacterium]|jgi:glutamate formiminotransferase
MLACVVNISEGREPEVIRALASAAGNHCLDVHTDADHHRSVFWLAGPDVRDAARALSAAAVARLSLSEHDGVHPRIGVVDVVPFVPIDAGSSIFDAIAARDEFALWAGSTLELPCFLYGPNRSLPEVRKSAFTTSVPDTGPRQPHPTAGAAAVGARGPLVAYNLWLAKGDLAQAKVVAAGLRGPDVRTLGLQVGDHVQVSCNLINPLRVGPAKVYDDVARRVGVARAELVGLIGRDVLHAIPERRWMELDVDEARTVEARLEQASLGGSSAGR